MLANLGSGSVSFVVYSMWPLHRKHRLCLNLLDSIVCQGIVDALCSDDLHQYGYDSSPCTTLSHDSY